MKQEKTANAFAPVRFFEAEEGHFANSYITANCWIDNERILAARLSRLQEMQCDYYEINICTNEQRLIYRNGKWPCFIVHNGMLYHTVENRLLRTHIARGTTEELYVNQSEAFFEGPPCMTEDGRFISLQWQCAEHSTALGLFDIENRTMNEVYQSRFPAPFSKATHCMVCPTDSNRVFFCHEGDCHYITDRLWLADCREKTARNLFRQRLNEQGANGECCGHEMWARDGKGLYFIKYIATTLPPKGVFYVDADTGKARSVAHKYPYWHVGAAHCAERLACDTQEENGDIHIVYIDIKKGIEQPIARAKTTWAHPVHPHPVFSPDDSKICFTTLNDEGRAVIGVCDISAFLDEQRGTPLIGKE